MNPDSAPTDNILKTEYVPNYKVMNTDSAPTDNVLKAEYAPNYKVMNTDSAPAQIIKILRPFSCIFS